MKGIRELENWWIPHIFFQKIRVGTGEIAAELQWENCG